jgi:phosphoribosylanthranilate isomerase
LETLSERALSGRKSVTIGVKICGIRTPADLEAAIEAGASHCGLVFYPPSPRSLSLDAAAELVRLGRGRITLVALVVDADDALIGDITRTVMPDMFQLHGKETPERAAHIQHISGHPLIKAVSVSDRGDVAAADRWRGAVDIILFDAKPPRLPGALPGGNGLSFDWSLLTGVSSCMPFALSGGLTADNVAEAIAATGAFLVDVSSGVEHAPGQKDAALIRRFVAAAREPILEGAAHG